MAVITTAVIAAGVAATASIGAVAAGVATAATIGTIAAVVGGLGIATSIVGMITKNEELTKIGGIMGAVGAGAGLGALAAGMLGLGPSVAAQGANAASSSTSQMAKAAGTPMADVSAAANPQIGAQVTQGVQQAGQAVPVAAGSVQAGAPAIASAAPSAGSAGSTAMAAAPAMQQVASTAMAPPAPMPTPAPIQAPASPSSLSVTPGAGVDVAAKPGFWGSMDPSSKVMLSLAGTQMLGQGMSGVFAGQTKGEELALQSQNLSLTQKQLQDLERQREFERHNRNYAPVVSFGRPGLIGRA